MSNFIIEINDKSKEETVIDFLKQIPYISIKEQKKTSKKKQSEFKKIFGIWSGKDIGLDAIRKKAWSRK